MDSNPYPQHQPKPATRNQESTQQDITANNSIKTVEQMGVNVEYNGMEFVEDIENGRIAEELAIYKTQ